jgi:hypothetical protein
MFKCKLETDTACILSLVLLQGQCMAFFANCFILVFIWKVLWVKIMHNVFAHNVIFKENHMHKKISQSSENTMQMGIHVLVCNSGFPAWWLTNLTANWKILVLIPIHTWAWSYQWKYPEKLSEFCQIFWLLKLLTNISDCVNLKQC